MAAGPADELFIVSFALPVRRSEFGHFRAGAFTSLEAFPPSPSADDHGRAVYLGEELALGARSTGPYAIVYDHGLVTHAFPGELSETISALRSGGAGVALAGTSQGAVFRRRNGRWTRLFSLPTPEAITAFEDGVVFGTESGGAGYYTSADGLCLGEGLVLPNRAVHFAPTSQGRWLVVGGRPFGNGAPRAGLLRVR